MELSVVILLGHKYKIEADNKKSINVFGHYDNTRYLFNGFGTERWGA